MKNKCRKGISLVEIMVALMILALAMMPIAGTFSQYYGVATRQMEQEIALKLGEAVINVLLSTTYSDLINGTTPDLPLNIQTPSGNYEGQLAFSGNTAEAAPVAIGKAKYTIRAQINTVFEAQTIGSIHDNALEFSYHSALPPITGGGPPPAPIIATYSSFDDLICINVTVDYGGNKPIRLSTFRADMTR